MNINAIVLEMNVVSLIVGLNYESDLENDTSTILKDHGDFDWYVDKDGTLLQSKDAKPSPFIDSFRQSRTSKMYNISTDGHCSFEEVSK